MAKTTSVNTNFRLEMQIFINFLNVSTVGVSRELYNVGFPRSALHYLKRYVSRITVINLSANPQPVIFLLVLHTASLSTTRTDRLHFYHRFIKECFSPVNHVDKCP